MSDPNPSNASSLLVYNERIKYKATWFNTVSAGAVIAGFVAPLAALAINGTFGWSMLLSFVWLPLGAALHYLCNETLSKLREEPIDERT